MADYRIALPDDYDSVAALIAAANAGVAAKDLHTEGQDADLLAKTMRETRAKGEFVALLREDGGAAIAAEYDEAKGRAWVWGPAFAETRRHSPINCAAAYIALAGALPGTVHRLSAFPAVENVAAIAGLERAGGTRTSLTQVYACRTHVPGTADASIRPAQEADLAAITALHDAAFPHTYLTAAEMLAREASGEGRLLVAQGGYVYAHVQEDGEGYVDFLAVDETRRGLGLGSRLLMAALAWLFVEKLVPVTRLTVRAENAAALGLYTKAGFVLEATGQAMDWHR